MSLSANAENWMSRLPDETFLSVVSIPGAHDAATGSGWADGMDGLGDLFARTQELTLPQLWSCGIRAFDLRPCVYEDYMNLNHGIVPTSVHFEDALRLLCDSLRANPSEFIVVHLLHETDGDQVSDAYNQRIQELLQQEEWQDCLIDFRVNLKVKDMRGKMLIISRDKYATDPTIGAFFQNWTGELNWAKQQNARIVGKRSNTARLCVQDYSDTHAPGGVEKKVEAINKVLDFSTQHKTTSSSGVYWVFNFASAYSLVESLFGIEISSSDGYRDNATHTHAAIIDYLSQNEPGPVGVILMDYAGIDQSGDFNTRGKELVDAIIANNFRYLADQSDVSSPSRQKAEDDALFTLEGKQVASPSSHKAYIQKGADGKLRKKLLKH